FLFPLILHVMGNPDPGVTFASNLAAFLMGCAFIAIGVMCSSFTENQVVAFLCSAALIFILFIVSWPHYIFQNEWTEVLKLIELETQYQEMAKGNLSLKSISYYLSIIAISLYFGHQSLEAKSSV